MPYDEYSTVPNNQTVSVTTSSTQLLGPSESREGLIISAPASGRLSLAFGQAAVLDSGITLHSGQDPLILDRMLHGKVVSLPVFGIMSAGTVSISVFSTTRS